MSSLSSVSRNSLVPDGGWGWLVVIGVALINVFNQSVVSVFGLLFGDQLKSMGHGTVGAALIMNVNSVALNFSGLITGPALKVFSPRQVAIVGSLLSGAGLILSSMSNQLWQLTITYGVLVGLGLGFINPSSFIAVNSYFSTKRSRAVGFALAGTGVGQMFMPIVVRYLLDDYGFKGAILIMGALALNGIVGASLFQPVEWHMKRFGNGSCSNEKRILLTPCRHHLNQHAYHQMINIDEDDNDNDDDYDIGIDSKNHLFNDQISIDSEAIILIRTKPNWRQRIYKALDLQLLSDPVFISICIGLALAYTASINFSMIFPYFLQETAHLSRGDAALCMSVLATADLASRLTLSTLTERLKLSCRSVFLIGAILLTISRTILAETLNRNKLIVISAIYGYVRAATVVNQNLTISEYATQDKLSSALSLNMIAKGIFVMSIGQFLGWIRDYTGSYTICLHTQNILLVIVIALWLPEILYRRFRQRKRPQTPVAI